MFSSNLAEFKTIQSVKGTSSDMIRSILGHSQNFYTIGGGGACKRTNKCQQLPTLLSVVGQQCCVCLHGSKSLTGFKLYATSANKCQHCYGSMVPRTQHCWPTTPNIVGPNNVVTCCFRLHGTTTMLALVGTCCV